MKLKILIPLLLIVSTSAYCQSSAEAIPQAGYTSSITSTIATAGFLATGVVVTDSTNATRICSPLEVRGNDKVSVLLTSMNITDSVKFMQYSWTADFWFPLVARVKHIPNVTLDGTAMPGLIAPGQDTTVTWVSRVITPQLGATIAVELELVTGGAVQIRRGVNDTTMVLRERRMRKSSRR